MPDSRRQAGHVIVFERSCLSEAQAKLTRSSPKRLYLIPVLSKALDILELLQKEKKPLPLEGIYQRTSISKTTVYRILKTFVHRGYLAQSQDG
jgi:ribose transport system substrate-binding protein